MIADLGDRNKWKSYLYPGKNPLLLGVGEWVMSWPSLLRYLPRSCFVIRSVIYKPNVTGILKTGPQNS